MSFSVIRTLPPVFSHFVTPARRRSSSIQSIHLLFSRPLDLFPVGYTYTPHSMPNERVFSNVYLTCLVLRGSKTEV